MPEQAEKLHTDALAEMDRRLRAVESERSSLATAVSTRAIAVATIATVIAALVLAGLRYAWTQLRRKDAP